MANLTSILVKIRDNIVDVSSATEARLEGWVNEAQQKAEARMQWVGQDFERVVATVAGTRKLTASPTVYLVPVGDPWYLTGIGTKVPMEWIPSRDDASKDYSEDTAISARGAPKGLLEVRGTGTGIPDWHVYPFPDASNTLGIKSSAGEYEIHIPYHGRDPVLSVSGNQTNFFTNDVDLQLFLEMWASGKAMLFNRDLENGQVALLEAREHLLRAVRLEKRRKSQSIKFQWRRDVRASRKQRRAS